jgi:hypothetical protein
MGQGSLYSNATGYNNVAMGQNSLFSNTAGNFNVALGYSVQSGNFSNSIILGRGATATGNNQFVVGSAGTNVGSFTTESCSSTQTWTVEINGVTKKILLA